MRRHDYIISQPTLNVKETSLPKIFFIKQVKQLEEKKHLKIKDSILKHSISWSHLYRF